MRKIKYATGDYYHIYNRGVDKRDIFVEEADYFRFIAGMREFNTFNPVINFYRFADSSMLKIIYDDKRIVGFVCYSLMPNHFHFLVRQLEDGGLSKFMQKLGTGYTKYFNKKHKRSGVLFQGPFKVKHISTDEYLIHLSRYIHLNALNLIRRNWMLKGVGDEIKAYNFLEKYKWHSLPFWFNKNYEPFHMDIENIIPDFFSSKGQYKKFLLSWIDEDQEMVRNLVGSSASHS